MHTPEGNQNQRKDKLKQLIADIDIDTNKLGSTLDELIQLIMTALVNVTEKEFYSLSASGFKKLIKKLKLFKIV